MGKVTGELRGTIGSAATLAATSWRKVASTETSSMGCMTKTGEGRLLKGYWTANIALINCKDLFWRAEQGMKRRPTRVLIYVPRYVHP